MPRSGPAQILERERGAARVGARRTGVVCRRAAISAGGENSTSAISGSVGYQVPSPDGPERLAERGGLDLVDPIADRRRRHRPQQIHLSVLLRTRPERVEANPGAGDQRDRPDTTGIAERAVLSFHIEDERPASEQEHPPQQRLDERALALPERAEHDCIRVIKVSSFVQHPRVEAERPAVRVAADEGPPPAEAAPAANG